MLLSPYESVKFERTGNHQGKAISSGKGSPGGEGWYEDSRSIAGFRGPAAGTGNQSTGVKPHDLGALHSCCKPRRSSGFGAKGSSGATEPADAGCAAATGTGFIEETSGIWPTSARLGWANAGGSLKGTPRSKGKGSASRKVDA